MHPDRLPLTSRQLQDWLEFNAIETIGEERADLRMGILANTIVAVSPNLKKGKKAPPPTAFMPFYRKPPDSPETIQRTIEAALRGLSRGRVNRKP